MTCHEAQSQIFAERDRAGEVTPRAEFESHVAQCAACRRIQDDLGAAFTTWRTDASRTTVPDTELEWQAVRRRIRNAGDASRPRKNWFAWITLPLGAAAAAAVAIMMTTPRPSPSHPEGVRDLVAQADLIDAPGNNASTMVFVDEKSGWLIVLASDAVPKQG